MDGTTQVTSMSQDTIGSKNRLGSARMISCVFSLQPWRMIFGSGGSGKYRIRCMVAP